MTSNTLGVSEFSEFFSAVYGYDPFPWQTRLLAEVLDKGWPRRLSLPTASGKTSVIDVAVFALAAKKRQARRIFFVIDRRIVVDDAYERSKRLAQKLAEANSGILKRVADKLRLLGDSTCPLDTACLRGGIILNEDWTQNPIQPTVVVSTVDQVGSRLLFRGYGVSPNSWPLQAALVGNDSLIVVDEAHCVPAFLETLSSVARYRGNPWQQESSLAPFSVVAMSATPGALESVFSADEDDRAHPELRRRFAAQKNTKLVLSADKDDDFARLVAKEASVLSVNASVTGVILNTVAGARRVFQELCAKNPKAKTLLLTGRVRPWERDQLLLDWLPLLRVGRNRTEEQSKDPVFVVATQCIEVGADLDFDALVTECAALDALRQRFGRLNRVGNAEKCSAVVVGRNSKKPHPIYGEASVNTWEWLNHLPTENADPKSVDFGINSMDAYLEKLSPAKLISCLTPKVLAPVLLPGHCDLLCQTSPLPYHSPDVAPFLHGEVRSTPDVTLVWRSELDESEESLWPSLVVLCPPHSSEGLDVPLYAFLKWVEEREDLLVLDQEGGDFEPKVQQRNSRNEGTTDSKVVLRWRGALDSATECVSVDEVRPGDTLILPVSWGGCDRYGWNPTSEECVDDLGCMSRHKSSQWVLRLNRNVRDWSSDASFHDRTLEKLVCLDRENETHEETFAAILLSIINEQSVKKWAKDVAREFLISKPNRRSIKWYPDGNGCVISVFNPNGADKDFRFEDQDASSGVALKEVTLLDHMKAVSQEAQTLATNIGIPDNLVQGCAIAALFHDLGKVDPRFQLLLRGGNRVALKEAKEPLAKSAARQWTRREFEVVQENSGYPRGTRHEVLSVALAQMYSQVREAPDPELVLGLISTHHGRCRPLVPVAAESPQLEVSFLFDGEKAVALASNASEHFSSEFCERFWNLIRRYGWWGHAFLELVVRLADQRVSREKRVE